MKVVVIGTRGIPRIQGGVETHCEELYPRLARLGCDVTVVRRSCYVTDDNREATFQGVQLKDIYAPRKKSIEAIVHTFLGVLYARKVGADVVHCHAVGPSIVVPFARLLGLKVVMTHHGPDYDRRKWGALAKAIIKTGERWGVKFANQVIVISHVIDQIIRTEYNRTDAHLIYNGTTRPLKTSRTDYLKKMGLEPRRYIMTLGRFVEEKGFDGLIRAYAHASLKGYSLVIAGDADHENSYSQRLKALARHHEVVLTGFITGEPLNQLMTHAALFVLPSFHEGLPISLLEAMSYDLPVLVSDIPANKEIGLPVDDYFRTGNWNSLATKLPLKLAAAENFFAVGAEKKYDLTNYDWDYIAQQVLQVYKETVNK